MRALTHIASVPPRGSLRAALLVAGAMLGALVAIAIAPRAAEAKTIVVGDSLSHPYQRWANGARLNRMPAPPERITVREVSSGCSACTWFREPAVIELRLPRHGLRDAWLHELGHRFDYSEMDARERFRMIRMMSGLRAQNGVRRVARGIRQVRRRGGPVARVATLRRRVAQRRQRVRRLKSRVERPASINRPPWLDRDQGHHSPHEVFADAYKACATMRVTRRGNRFIRSSFLSPPGFTERHVLRTCDLIERAAG